MSIKYPLSGFFDAIFAGCSSSNLALNGGYNSTSGELAINVAVELSASRNLRSALKSLASMLGNDLFLDQEFFDELSLLEELVLGGSLLIDVTFGASIPNSAIENKTYGGTSLFLRVNDFAAAASLEADSLNLDFPLSLPNTGVSPADKLVLALNDGSFSVDFFVNLTNPLEIQDLFSESEANATKFDYGGTLAARLPVELLFQTDVSTITGSPSSEPTNNPTISQAPSMSTFPSLSTQPSWHPSSLPSVQPSLSFEPSSLPSSQPSTAPSRFGFTLIVTDSDLFSPPPPTVEFEYDVCPIIEELEDAILSFAQDISVTLQNELDSIAPSSLEINLGKITGKKFATYV